MKTAGGSFVAGATAALGAVSLWFALRALKDLDRRLLRLWGVFVVIAAIFHILVGLASLIGLNLVAS